MANWDLVNYVETQIAKGFSHEQIFQNMINSGHHPKDVAEAHKVVKTNQIRSSHFKQMQTTYFKHREPWLEVLLWFVTLGLYFFIWLWKTSLEVKHKDKTMLSPWLILVFFIPLVGIFIGLIYIWKFCEKISYLSGYDNVRLYFLLVILNPVGVYISQKELNLFALRTK